MSNKFKSVPIDEDTKITFQLEAKLGDIDVLYQKWNWEGISAESLIFCNDDISKLSEEEIEKEVRSSPLVASESKMTIKKSEFGFTFVNFNFKTS